MAKKANQVQDNTDHSEAEPEYDSFAVGHVKRAEGNYDVVKVHICSKTLQSKVEVVQPNVDRAEALYEFKITAVQLGLV